MPQNRVKKARTVMMTPVILKSLSEPFEPALIWAFARTSSISAVPLGPTPFFLLAPGTFRWRKLPCGVAVVAAPMMGNLRKTDVQSTSAHDSRDDVGCAGRSLAEDTKGRNTCHDDKRLESTYESNKRKQPSPVSQINERLGSVAGDEKFNGYLPRKSNRRGFAWIVY